MKKFNKKIMFVLLVLMVLINFVSCSEFYCTRFYDADVEYTVSDVVFSVYDKDDGSLISKTELSNYDEIQTGDFVNTDRNNFTDTELRFVAFTTDAKRIAVTLYIGEDFQSLELNDSLETGSGYLLYGFYYNEGDADDVRYETATNTYNLSYVSDGYYITFAVKPYTLNDDEEKVYEDTQKIEFVMSDLTIVEDSVNTQTLCSN